MQTVAGYRPFAELARGAAVVYKAYDPREERTVLLKVLTPEAAEDPALVAWFEGEARAFAEVEHENVVALYEAGRDGGRPFLAAEFVEGRSLAEVLAEGPLPADLAAYVAASAARGLAAAHERGLLHRDVKPGNVLLALDGSVKLTDFGLATRAGAGEGDGAGVRGTPGYLAPEVIRGSPPGPASDLFALGAVLVESATGRPAFPSAGAADALDVALHHDPVPALHADPRVPAGLAEVAASLLQKDPPARLGSAVEAALALDALWPQGAAAGAAQLASFLDDPVGYAAAHPAPAHVPAALAPRAHPLRRPRTLVAAAAAVALVAAVFALRGSGEEPRPASPAPVETAGGVTLRPAPAARPATAVPTADSAAQTPPAAVPPPGEAPPPEPQPPAVVDEGPARPEPAQGPPAAVPNGDLVVAVEPWARVTVGGRDVGTTPLAAPISLPAGRHRVVLQNPDFPDHAVDVVVPPGGSERLAVSLWSLVARVNVEVSPWAEVAVDGRPAGTTPLRRALVMAPGNHTIRFTHPTLGEREERLTVAAGESRTVRVRMGG